MQVAAMQEQMEQVIPEWCAANGFGDDPVTLSTFTELAVRLLSVLPRDPSDDTWGPTLGPSLHLADACLVEEIVTDDAISENLLRPFATGESLGPHSPGLPGVTATNLTPPAKPASTTASRPSPPVEWMPDCSGDWRPLLHGDEWWVVGLYMMYPARDETAAERLCQELVRQN